GEGDVPPGLVRRGRGGRPRRFGLLRRRRLVGRGGGAEARQRAGAGQEARGQEQGGRHFGLAQEHGLAPFLDEVGDAGGTECHGRLAAGKAEGGPGGRVAEGGRRGGLGGAGQEEGERPGGGERQAPAGQPLAQQFAAAGDAGAQGCQRAAQLARRLG